MAQDDMKPVDTVPVLSDRQLKQYRRDIRHQLTRAMHQYEELQTTFCYLDDLLGSGGQLGGPTDVPQTVMFAFVMDLADQYYGPDGLDGMRASLADVDEFIRVCRTEAAAARKEQLDALRAANPNATIIEGNGHVHP